MPRKKKPTSAQYQAAMRGRLAEAGKTSVTVFLGPEARESLAELREATGNNSAAVETALNVTAKLLRKQRAQKNPPV